MYNRSTRTFGDTVRCSFYSGSYEKRSVANQVALPCSAPSHSLSFRLDPSGVSQFLIPWIEKSGYVAPLMVNAGLTILFTLGGSIFLWFFGKTLRRWTKNSYIHRM